MKGILKMKKLDKKEIDYKPTFFEKCLLQMIESMVSDKNNFFQSNEKIATIFELTPQSVSSMISRLVRYGYIVKTIIDKKRYLKYTGKEYAKLPIFMNYSKTVALYSMNKTKKMEEEMISLKLENETLKSRIKDLESKLKK